MTIRIVSNGHAQAQFQYFEDEVSRVKADVFGTDASQVLVSSEMCAPRGGKQGRVKIKH
jgi:hypothetical protein